MSRNPPSTNIMRRAAVTAAVVGWLLTLAAPAWAHVDLVTSSPVDGAVVEGSVAEIALDFSTASVIAGDGIVLYDETASPVAATVEAVSGTRVMLRPFSPLPPGNWAVTWTMQAPDAHPTTGGFEFQVTTASSPPGGQSDQPTQPALVQGSILDDVIPSSSGLADWIGRLARMMSLLGAMFGIGSLAFALFVFEGARHEARTIGFWIRRSGAALLISVPLELWEQALIQSNGSLLGAMAPGAVVGALGGALGIALLLRLVGGFALLAGTRLVTVAAVEPYRPVRSRQSDVLVATRERLHLTASPAALAGGLAVAVSFLFDGHTVTTAPNALVRLASLVHVAAAATWVAGLTLLARLLMGRHKRGLPLDGARLIIPFSSVAGVAVALVGLAGGVLALAIADGIETFFTTPWGRAMLAKLVLAGSAGAIGAYNHREIVPVLRARRDDEFALRSIRRTVGVEAALVIGVVLITAVLVGVSST